MMCDDLMLVGNYNYAGTHKFISHAMWDEHLTVCGLKVWHLKGDYQEMTEGSCSRTKPICKKCQKKLAKLEGE